jgi:hypothetical protein
VETLPLGAISSKPLIIKLIKKGKFLFDKVLDEIKITIAKLFGKLSSSS